MIIVVALAVISLVQYLINKGEHTTLYKISQTYKIYT